MSHIPEPRRREKLKTDGLELELCRFGDDTARSSVLLMHGASASRDTFLVPDGGLVAYLGEQGFDVWTLDWRGSNRVMDPLVGVRASGLPQDDYRTFTLDRVANQDVPLALAFIRKTIGPSKAISVVAHCLGSGAFSMAIARGTTAGIRNVVLMTLGLFYEVPWDGWIKAEDFILERILAHDPGCRAIDPRRPKDWPPDMVEAYDAFPKVWLPPVAPDNEADEILQRLAFMFGAPYPKEALAPGIHGPELKRLFGSMPIGLYIHAGQNVRRGFAADFDVLDVIDRPRLDDGPRAEPARGRGPRAMASHYGPETGLPAVTDLRPAPFREKRITLIAGAENRLWHRDSVDLMYEWLLAEKPSGDGDRPKKHVFQGYAHQDLLWGRYARDDVYGTIADGLRR